MIRCYRLDSSAQALIDRLVLDYGENMTGIESDLAQTLCQAQMELNSHGELIYNAEVPNIIPAYGIMRLEANGLIKRDAIREAVIVKLEYQEALEEEE